MKSIPVNLLVGLGLLAAAVLAAASFIVPLPFLNPPEDVTEVPDPPAGVAGEGKEPELPEIRPNEWVALAEPLQKIRSPEQPVTPLDEEPEEAVAQGEEEKGPGPFLSALRWEYMAYVVNPIAGGDEQVIAWLRTDSGQKIVAPGQRLSATVGGRTQTVTIEKITETELVVSTESESRTLRILPRESPSDEFAARTANEA